MSQHRASRPSGLCWCVAFTAWLAAGCGSGGAPTGVATNPGLQGTGSGTVNASPTPSQAGGVRTVLSPLGLNIRSGPSTNAAKLGTAAQGAELTVIGQTDQNGGWYMVQGQTVTGWVIGDPSLSAAGMFTQYQSSQRAFSALYQQGWTFADGVAAVVFHPVSGPQTIVVRNGTTTADFGAAGGAGFVGAGQQTVIVCGVTADLNLFSHTGPSPPAPAPGTAGPLALLAQIRLRLDATHALALDFNYTVAADLEAFSDFYNSMTFPFPQCQLPATPSAVPA